TAGQKVTARTGPGENAGADSPLPTRTRQPAPAPGGGGGGFGGLSVDGLPLVKPPYGTISAINLDRGEIVWQIAHGETPDVVRNHPVLKGLNIQRADVVGRLAGARDVESFEHRMIAHHVGRFSMSDLLHDFAAGEIDRRDGPIRRLDQRQGIDT